MEPMLANWVAASLAIIGTVLLQFGAQSVLLRAARRRHGRVLHEHLHRPHLVVVPTLIVVFVLILGHLAQMAVWAVAYAALGELSDVSNAIYFSMASYTTVGTEHLALTTSHRILGALEAGVGIMMFGWSTALLVALLVRVDVGGDKR